MRILFVSRWFPFPPDNGSRIRVYNLLKQLSRRHEITLLSFCEETASEERRKAAERYCTSVRTVPFRRYRSRSLKALLGYLSLRPRFLVDTFSLEMKNLVRSEIQSSRFDVAIASQIDSVPYILDLSHLPCVFEEVELAIRRDQFLGQANLMRKARDGLTWYKLTHFVTRVLYRFDGCTVVSDQERELVESFAPRQANVVIVPNGVDLEMNAGDFGKPVPDTLIYPGALTYSANFDAMHFFLRDILPLVREQCPVARLRITGKYDGVPIEQLALGKGVELTGYLNDIRPAVAQSWVCVVPLRAGGGTRLKILEAMALGTPVVSTSKGAEGLGVEHGRDILIADEPQDFARCVLDLLRDEQLRATLAKNGRRLVEEHYSWEQCAYHLEELLDRVQGTGVGV